MSKEFEVSVKENNQKRGVAEVGEGIGGIGDIAIAAVEGKGSNLVGGIGRNSCRDGLKCFRIDCRHYHPPCVDEIQSIGRDTISKQKLKLKEMNSSVKLKNSKLDELKARSGSTEIKATQEDIIAMKGLIHIAESQLNESRTALRFISDGRFGLMQLQRESRRLSSGLPFYGFRSQVVNAVRLHNVVIIIGETGSGKSTQVSFQI